MATENVQISGPVRIQSDSPQRIAFELMQLVASHSRLSIEDKNETYWFTTYARCLNVVNGYDP